MMAFFNMGGYAGFVWPAWGIAAAVIIAVSIRSILRARAMQRRLKAIEDMRR